MAAGQAASVVQATFRVVGTDVVVVSLCQFLDTLLNASNRENKMLLSRFSSNAVL